MEKGYKFKGSPYIQCEIEVESSTDKKAKRRERNKKRAMVASTVLCLALFFDILVFIIALLSNDIDTAAFTFLAIFVIVPPMIFLVGFNDDSPFYWPFFD